MKIEILDMDLRKGLFLVGSPQTGEQLKVTGYQLVYSLTGVNECSNAKLHNTGIFIKLKNGEVVKYNVRPIDAKMKIAIKKYFTEHPELKESKPEQQPKQNVEKLKDTEEQSRKVLEQPKAIVNKPEARIRPVIKSEHNKVEKEISSGLIKRQISDNKNGLMKEEHIKIYHMGTIYSPKELCKKYGCADVEKFTRLYKLGYPLMMCLGKEEFNPNLKPVPREKQYDAYLKSTGQYM